MATSKNINWKVESITLDRNNPFEHPMFTAELITTTFPKTYNTTELAMDLQDHLNRKSVPEIKNVIFNDPATIILWSDNTKTVVKCQEGDKYDPEKGLAMAIVKRMNGNTGKYCEIFKKWIKEEEEECDYPEITIDFGNANFKAAIEKIQKAAKASAMSMVEAANAYGSTINNFAEKEAAKTRAEKLEKETGWISTKDKMPDKSGDYLVYDLSSRSVYVYEFEIDSIADATHWHNCIPHWMPCPAAPNKKGE
jgi:hypothetical protein